MVNHRRTLLVLFVVTMAVSIYIMKLSAIYTHQRPLPPPSVKPLSKQAAADQKNEVRLVAFYYAWYHKSKDKDQGWARHGRHEDPLLGFYESHDPRVIEQHIDWATAYGIDAFCISTIGSPEKILAARNIDKIKIIPLIEYWSVFEPPLEYDLSEKRNQDKMNAYLKKLIPLLTHPSAMKIDGKVVVYFYLTRLMRDFPVEAKEAITSGLPVEIFWVADEVFPLENTRYPETAPNGLSGRQEPLFDSYTSYNMYVNLWLTFVAETRNLGKNVVQYTKDHMLPFYKRWARVTRFFPHVMSRYRDFRPENPPLWGNPEDFRKVLRMVLELPRGPKAKGPHLVFLTTFNEWWEGTALEPSEQWGFEFLEALRQEVKPHLPTPAYTVEQYRSPASKEDAWWMEYRDFMEEQYAGREPTVFPQPTIEIEEPRKLTDNYA